MPLGIYCLSINHLFTFYTCIYVYLSFNYIFLSCIYRLYLYIDLLSTYQLSTYLSSSSISIIYYLSLSIHRYACLMTYIHPSINLSISICIYYLPISDL